MEVSALSPLVLSLLIALLPTAIGVLMRQRTGKQQNIGLVRAAATGEDNAAMHPATSHPIHPQSRPARQNPALLRLRISVGQRSASDSCPFTNPKAMRGSPAPPSSPRTPPSSSPLQACYSSNPYFSGRLHERSLELPPLRNASAPTTLR